MKLIAKIVVESEVLEAEKEKVIKIYADKNMLEEIKQDIAEELLQRDGREETIDIKFEFVE